MVETMIERVARALCERQVRADLAKDWPEGQSVELREECVRDAVGKFWRGHIDAARSAVAAMREPTEAMKRLYYEKGGPPGWAEYGLDRHKGEFVEVALAAMIDAALEEG